MPSILQCRILTNYYILVSSTIKITSCDITFTISLKALLNPKKSNERLGHFRHLGYITAGPMVYGTCYHELDSVLEIVNTIVIT